MSVTKERRAFLKEQCRLFAAGVIEDIEVIASGRFDHLALSHEEMTILENEKMAIADRIWKVRRTPAPVEISVGIEDHSVAARYRRLHRIIERILWSGPGKPAMDHPQTQEAMSELSDVMLMDALIEASAPAKDERSPDELLARMNRAADLAMHAYVSSAKPETLAHLRKMIDAKMPAPAGHVVASEPVQDQWFTDRNLPIMALSDDVESDRVLKLISETESWRVFHRSKGAHIEAAACAIRIKALKDALAALGGGE